MASRPVFIADLKENTFVRSVDIDFEWYPGFSIKQKQRSIESLHDNFKDKYSDQKILEISSKSNNDLGVALSAFNLMIHTKNGLSFSVESAFQSSKVFKEGGPFTDLLLKSSKDAKKDPRLKSSGKLICFKYFNREWALEPKTLFYDWLYINALSLNRELSQKILEFDAFSDIEFNPEKSINCQAKSAALFISLHRLNLLEAATTSIDRYINIFGIKLDKTKPYNNLDAEQLNMFDFD